MPTPPPDAHYIWTDPHGRGRNRWAMFRKAFDLREKPGGAALHLFADTRYRLMVNGVTVGHGPARFFLRKPEYDTHDIAPFLRPGRNVVAVLVNSAGAVTFHNEASVAGLIAWGGVGGVSLATDESWKTIDSPAHRPDTAYLSFALNPGELLDLRAHPRAWPEVEFDDSSWPAAVVHARPEHWGPLAPRSIPLLDEREAEPVALHGVWAGRSIADETVVSVRAIAPGGQSLHTRAKAAVMTFLHSPRDQEVTLGAWWGRYWLNGEALAPSRKLDAHRRQEFPLKLRKGVNTLLVVEQLNRDFWELYLGVPRESGVAFSADARGPSENTLLLGGPWEGESAQRWDAVALPLRSPEDLPAELGPWRVVSRQDAAESPYIERAWRTFAKREGARALDPAQPAPRFDAGDASSASFVYDFGGEVLGRPLIEFTAAAGTRVDLTYSEKLLPDGLPDVTYNYVVQMAERCIARDGRQQWHAFHPRGFRYLEVHVTAPPHAPDSLATFELHRVSLTRANYPVPEPSRGGSFRCSDPRLETIWRVGRDTLHACMEDAYLDCPHRERGLYVGDLLVQFAVNTAAFGDTQLLRRCIELFLLAQGENGLVSGGAHGLPAGRHPDYSAMIPILLHTYWAHSGDADFLRASVPAMRKLVAGIDALRAEGEDALLDGSDLHPYVDLSFVDKRGINAPLNLFYEACFRHASLVLDAIGEPAEAQRWRGRADALAAAIREAFWDEARGVFVDRRRSDEPQTQPSVVSNALALLWGVATPEQAERALPWLVDAMRNNFRVPEPTRNDECNVTSYFSFYALGAILRHGRVREATEFMRRYWGHMLDGGAWTWWEYFTTRGISSLCHAWSAAPTHYLTRDVLGVRLAVEPGNPDVVEIRPGAASGLEWAEGTVPHRRGPIRVAWRKQGEGIELNVDAPPGVEVRRA